jgi:hypothetical protein
LWPLVGSSLTLMLALAVIVVVAGARGAIWVVWREVRASSAARTGAVLRGALVSS